MPTKTRKLHRLTLLTGGLVLGTSLMAMPVPQDHQGAADNTRQNKEAGPTADQQRMNSSDRDKTQRIRKSVYADKNLSTYGHNVKIVTQHGKVTLRGPVRSDEERKNIHNKAAAEVGEANVTDQMQVAPPRQK